MTRLVAFVVIAVTVLAAADATLAQPGGRAPRRGELAVFSNANFRGRHFFVTNPSHNLNIPFHVRSFMMAPGERWSLCTGVNFTRDCKWFDRNEPDRGAASGIAIRSARSNWTGRRW